MEVSIKTKDANNADQEMTLRLPAYALHSVQQSLTSYGQTIDPRNSGSTYGRFTRDLSPMQNRASQWRTGGLGDSQHFSRSSRTTSKSVERPAFAFTQASVKVPEMTEEDEQDAKEKRSQAIKELIDTKVFTPKFWDLDYQENGSHLGSTSLFGQTQDPMLLGVGQMKSTGKFQFTNPESQRSFRFGQPPQDGESVGEKNVVEKQAFVTGSAFNLSRTGSSRSIGVPLSSKVTNNPVFQAAIEATLNKFDKDMDTIFQRPERKNDNSRRVDLEEKSGDQSDEVLSKNTFNLGRSALPTPMSTKPEGFFKKQAPHQLVNMDDSMDDTRSAKDFISKLAGQSLNQENQHQQNGAHYRQYEDITYRRMEHFDNNENFYHDQLSHYFTPNMTGEHSTGSYGPQSDNKYRQWINDTRRVVNETAQQVQRSTPTQSKYLGIRSQLPANIQDLRSGANQSRTEDQNDVRGYNPGFGYLGSSYHRQEVRYSHITRDLPNDDGEYYAIENYDSSGQGSDLDFDAYPTKIPGGQIPINGYLGSQIAATEEHINNQNVVTPKISSLRTSTFNESALENEHTDSKYMITSSQCKFTPQKSERDLRERSKSKPARYSALQLDLEAIHAREPDTPSMTEGTMLDDIGLDTPVMKALSSIQGKIAELNLLMEKSSAIKTGEKLLPRLDLQASAPRNNLSLREIDDIAGGGSLWKIEEGKTSNFSPGKLDQPDDDITLSASKLNERPSRSQNKLQAGSFSGRKSSDTHSNFEIRELAALVNQKHELNHSESKFEIGANGLDKENHRPTGEDKIEAPTKVAQQLQSSHSLIEKLKRASVSSQHWQ